MKRTHLLIGGLLLTALLSQGQQRATQSKAVDPARVNAVLPQIETLYLDLHEHPELSLQEHATSAKLAERVKALGYDVTTGVGGTGVVAVMRNGQGPTVMFRTDMDALPVEEKTGVPYASHVHEKDSSGKDVPVMHACGHDIHMSSWVGTATVMARTRDQWHGTLIMIAQPAEEIIKGARAMLNDGLYTKFPKPDFVLGMHDAPAPVGDIFFTPGPAMAGSDSVDITIFGKGGHGALPQTTIDPVVIAARTVLALQTIISREMDPRTPAVITVGKIEGGTKNNIIPDEVHLGLTVRSFTPAARKQLLSAIERITRAEAEAAGAPRPPEFQYPETTTPQVNDPQLTARVVAGLRREFGDQHVIEQPPLMVSEDFAAYAESGVPTFMFHLGAIDPAKLAQMKAEGKPVPSLHSSTFIPDYRPTLQFAVTAEVTALMELLAP
jgi:amidohydrolase